MVVIEKLAVKRKYRYFWLKFVTGIDLNVHCARCLAGSYSKSVNANQQEFAGICLPASPFYYLCGVRNYVDNIHVAFRESPGSLIQLDDELLTLTIRNAERVMFDDSFIDPNHPKAGIKAYNTCRNWQFAHWLRSQSIM